MKRQETIKILTVIKLTFPNAFTKTTPEDFRLMIDTWDELLGDYEYPEVNAGLVSFIKTDTSGFPPAVGQIIAMIPSIRNDASVTMNALEAWALVSKAIRNSNYHADEEFDALPPLVRKAVGNPATLREWAAMDSRTVHSVEQSNFMRTYEMLVKRAKDDVKLPPQFRMSLEQKKAEAIEDKQAQDNGDRASAEHIDKLMNELREGFKNETDSI